MKRHSFIQNGAILIPALWSVDNLLKSLQTDPWNIKMLTKEIGIFTERGGTILFYLSKKGNVVVDSQFPEQADHLISEIQKKNDYPFEVLINTHHHGDHSGGNMAFKDLLKRVLAHSNSKINQMKVAKERNMEATQLFPTQTFDNVWSEKIGKERVTLHYFGAGHTNGDSLIHFEKANIVHLGDLMFNRRHPNVDRTAGANIKSWINVLEETNKTFNSRTSFVFGHAAEGYAVTGSKSDLTAFKNYLTALMEHTAKSIAQGTPLAELIKTTSIPGAPEWKGDGIARPLTAAYEELTTAK
ncbi:MAG: MBL fold metallo-hydrolase [Saprospiraceae bacterium]|nr:MBL fold metallo-hydrolase [Saprospiraceae bacterium]